MPRFLLGILGFFDQILANAFVSIDKKQDILRSMVSVSFFKDQNMIWQRHSASACCFVKMFCLINIELLSKMSPNRTLAFLNFSIVGFRGSLLSHV